MTPDLSSSTRSNSGCLPGGGRRGRYQRRRPLAGQLRASYVRSRGRLRRQSTPLRSRLADQGDRDDDASSMDLVERGALRLEEPVSRFFDEWRGADREGVTVRDLLEHASGLPARLLDAPPCERREFEHEICDIPLEYAPRTTSIYSDLGFILLGISRWPIAAVAPLDQSFERSWSEPFRRRDVRTRDLTMRRARPRRRGRWTTTRDADGLLSGEVHDNYAAALGGVAGHAGLFGSAPASAPSRAACFSAARGAIRAATPFSPAIVRTFTTRAPSRAARARSAGIRCCRLRRAARGCRPRRSATSASPARRCGSTRNAIAISCC